MVWAVSVLVAQYNRDSAAAILARARQAAGGDAWSHVAEITTEGNVQAGKNHVSLHYLEDVTSGQNVLHLKFPSGAEMAQGTVVQDSWQQDARGYITVSDDQNSRKDAIDDRYLTRRAYWLPDFGRAAISVLSPTAAEQSAYDRVSVKPEGGRGFILWINRQTHLIARVEHPGDQPYTEFWSDYRQVPLAPPNSGAVRVPFNVVVQPGAQQFVYTSRQVLETCRKADFVIPFQHDYELPKEGRASVPFFTSTGIVLKVKINGQGPFAVILDSGMSSNLISSELAKRLGLKVEGETPLAGIAGSVKVRHTSVQSLQIGGLALHNQPFEVIDVPYSLTHSWQEPLVAGIGYPLFRRLAVEVNYQKHELTFYDGASFVYAGKGTEIPMHISDGWLVADGYVQGIPGIFSLDTGQENVSLTLFNSFIRRTGINKELGERFCGISGESFGGVEHACFSRSSSFTLGPVVAKDLITMLSRDTTAISSTTSIAGNVGTGFFRKFTVTFDAMHQKLFLEKNEDYASRDVFNRAGLVLQLVPEGDKVLNVFAGSPAAEAGIEQGDILTSINGHQASEPAFSTTDEVFREPVGTVVQTTVQHGNSSRKLRMILRDVL